MTPVYLFLTFSSDNHRSSFIVVGMGGGGGVGGSIELNRDTFLSPTIRRGGDVGPSLLRKYMFESKEN
jgi:hypothetical protein